MPSSDHSAPDGAIQRVVDRLNLVIPEEIHGYRQWVLWRYEPGEDKPRKVPYYVNGRRRSGTQGSEADLSQMATFPEAVTRLKGGGFDGVGLAILPNSPIKAIDLDNCVASGTLNAHAEAIVGEANSYYELSPSRTGVRILAYGVLPSRKAMHLFGPGQHLELFGVSGFVTVTGDVLVGSLADTPVSLAMTNSTLNASGWLSLGHETGTANSTTILTRAHQVRYLP